MRKTKIVCTLGPATDDINVLRKLFKGGLNVGRLNFSHSNYDDQQLRIDQFKKLRDEVGVPAALLLDTKGPEIRLGMVEDGKIILKTGTTVVFTPKEVMGTTEIISISYKSLAKDVVKGAPILIDDGLIELKVLAIDGEDVRCEVLNGGEVGNNKGVNVPGVTINIPFISEKDYNDILFGIKNDFEYIAASFVRSAEDVKDIKKILDENNGDFIKIIAKIENQDGVRNIDEIVSISDGVMVARGDMGVEIPFEEIPAVQKRIIKKCYKAGKPVITATQMLDSMIRNPRPTRAEITDVANAIYDGTSALMLSGEIAIGKYPVETLATMSKIAVETEKNIDYIDRFEKDNTHLLGSVTNAISYATCSTAHTLGAAAIVTITESGQTAKMVSKYRPAAPIIATTMSEKVRNQLALTWGVIPVITTLQDHTDAMFDEAIEKADETGLIKTGDLVVITGGMPVGITGTTNMMKTHIMGDVLIEAKGLNDKVASGIVHIVTGEEKEIEKFNAGDILVVKETTNEVLSYIKYAKAIVTEESDVESKAIVVARALGIPTVYDAAQATQILKNGTAVTVNGGKGYVCSGVKIPEN